VPHSDPTIALLEDLVAIDSVNPSLVSGARGEEEIARRIAAECGAAGLSVSVNEVTPGRPNVVAVLEGRNPGPTLMFCGHVDTVGVAGMEQPFRPVHRDGRLYGRGAQDMKGGIAAMLGAARQVVEQGGCAHGRLIVAAVVDEEHASIGAEALAEAWRADAAVVTEPTDLDIAVAHKGFEWIRVETHGRAAHGSRPLEGRDGAEVPEALQIVLTVGCPRRRPCLGGRRTGGHGDSQYDRERELSRAHASLRCCPEG